MFEVRTHPVDHADKPAFYAEVAEQARALLHGERDRVANAANLSALIWMLLPDLNWAGFYFSAPAADGVGQELVVGPFQGKPACVRIALGKGVCGTAAVTRQTQVIADVHAFPGHIACDAASNAEIVVPLVRGDELLGVLDLDSPVHGRFDADDRAGLEALARIWVESLG
ncbi:GAF domain-containing protein [Solimonas marina]|uniref:GAF domain-containing protein n=1 Tax=Solimonas marina TaxID=2714601 RepID=A0A969W5U3_9GAMM|nr:GAF domain-containing protein [Solimonas marina]NKF21122.1 GAF domain-containing protein [Solimonas marina]